MAKRKAGSFQAGVWAIGKKITGMLSSVPGTTTDGMQDVVDLILVDSNARAPRDMGDLTRTSEAVVTVEPDGEIVGTIYYPEPYAAKQHEMVDYHHDEGEAKFLEKAMYDALPEIAQMVGNAIRDGLQAGGD